MASEAKVRANNKYGEKTYSQFNMRLRNFEDDDIISNIKVAQEKGVSVRDWVRDLFRGGNNEITVRELIRHFPKGQHVVVIKNGEVTGGNIFDDDIYSSPIRSWQYLPNRDLRIEI